MTRPALASRRAARATLRAVSGKLQRSAYANPQFPRKRGVAPALAAAVAVLAAGCGGPGAPDRDGQVPQPFAACAQVTGRAPTTAQPSATDADPAAPGSGPSPAAPGGGGSPAASGSGPSPAASSSGMSSAAAAGGRSGVRLRVVELPELSLPCLAGGDDVRLGQLRGPLVINLWGSWCEPCRAELPALQRLADSGRVPVLGVVTRDERAAAAWLADELKISMPAVYDRAGALQAALGEKLLPMTLLVGPDGRAAVYRDVALTDEALSELVGRQLGVA